MSYTECLSLSFSSSSSFRAIFLASLLRLEERGISYDYYEEEKSVLGVEVAKPLAFEVFNLE